MAKAKTFDVALMDIQMPFLDGHEATKKLPESKYAAPIIGLTAHAMEEEQDNCLAPGFTETISKPVQKDLLIEMLIRYVP